MNKKKLISYIKLLEKYSGKKVKLKEADEATKNQAVNNLHFINTSISNILEKIDELQDIPILTKERNITLNKISNSLSKINEQVDSLIEEITATRTDEIEKPLEEDVTMTTDDIIKNPQTVKKLADRKIDVKVKDKNSASSGNSSAYM